MNPNGDPLVIVQSIAEVLLIGLIIGVQRETGGSGHAGLRDFLLIGLAGGLCAILGEPWLTATALLSIVAILLLQHFEQRNERTGITTELTAVATFCITYFTAAPGIPMAAPIAIGAAIAVAAFLEAKRRLHDFFRETITDGEFNGTLAFVAVVLVIYPLLPAGRYGPYDFFSPREVWFYVILISAISYSGYFLQKFMGPERGLGYTAVLGGLASTLATTVDFARRSRLEPGRSAPYARAAVIANCVQFPRTLLILMAASPAMGRRGALPLSACLAAGAALAWIFGRWVHDVPEQAGPMGNPFRVRPALTFGAMFAALAFLDRFTRAEVGGLAVYATSALGGLVDPGTVVLSTANQLNQNSLEPRVAITFVWAALAANIALKCGVAFAFGTASFAWRVGSALAVMTGCGAAAWLWLP